MTGLAFTNPNVQRLRRLLGQRSARQAEGAFVIEGPALVGEALEAGLVLEAIYVEAGYDGPAAPGVPVVELARGVIARVATTVAPRPVLAVARRNDRPLSALAAARFVVVTAGIADPGNLGTILRVAEASGADGVVLTEGSVDPFNPKVVRSSAGALFHVPVVVGVAGDQLRTLGLPLLAAAAVSGLPYDEAPLDPPLALVLGSEAHGVPADLAVDGVVSIPHQGRAESLNVAMAAAVLCFEVARRLRPA